MIDWSLDGEGNLSAEYKEVGRMHYLWMVLKEKAGR